MKLALALLLLTGCDVYYDACEQGRVGAGSGGVVVRRFELHDSGANDD